MQNKNNIICILILSIVFIFICIFTYGKGGSFIWDHFREATIADAILRGEILYKDIMALFAPLAYYLNAFLFYIFSSNLNVLYWAGIINSIIILACIYKIMLEIASLRAAFITVLSVLIILVSCKHTILTTIDWFFPYSYSFIYAFSACIISFTCYILYLKKHNLKYLYSACFFIGLSISFKFDYTCFTLVVLICLLRLKSLSKFFKGLFFFILPIFITFLILYIQAGNDIFNILHDECVYLYKYITNPLTQDFYKDVLPLGINKKIITYITASLLIFTQFFITIFLILLLEYSLLEKFCIKLKLTEKTIIELVLISGLIIFLFFNRNPYFLTELFNVPNVMGTRNLVFLSYAVLLFAIGLLIYNKIKKKEFSKKEKLLYLLLPVIFLINFREFTAIYLSYIGNFNIIYFWMLFIYIMLELLPEKFPKLNTIRYKNTFCIALIIYSLLFIMISLPCYRALKYEIRTEKGFFYTSFDYYFAIKQIFQHVEDNIIGKNKSILYIPEGSYLHYMLKIPFINMNLYQLQGHTTPAIGEDYIIEILRKNKTDYIYIYLWENESQKFFIKFGEKLFNYIRKNYELEKIIYSGGDNIYIYKIKQKNYELENFKDIELHNILPLTEATKMK